MKCLIISSDKNQAGYAYCLICLYTKCIYKMICSFCLSNKPFPTDSDWLVCVCVNTWLYHQPGAACRPHQVHVIYLLNCLSAIHAAHVWHRWWWSLTLSSPCSHFSQKNRKNLIRQSVFYLLLLQGFWSNNCSWRFILSSEHHVWSLICSVHGILQNSIEFGQLIVSNTMEP